MPPRDESVRVCGVATVGSRSARVQGEWPEIGRSLVFIQLLRQGGQRVPADAEELGGFVFWDEEEAHCFLRGGEKTGRGVPAPLNRWFFVAR